MQIHPTPQGVVLTLARAEAHFVAHVLGRILENYENPAGDESFTPHWDGREALRRSGASPEDEELWMEERAAFRSAHAGALRSWRQRLAAASGEWMEWRLDAGEIGVFLLTANDHRMYLAHRYAVGEQDMESRLEEIADDDRRMALVEIHLLAQMMEMLLPHAPM
jgi:hypothetical protein